MITDNKKSLELFALGIFVYNTKFGGGVVGAHDDRGHGSVFCPPEEAKKGNC